MISIRIERSATMSNTFTLEALQEELENEYAPLVFQAGDEEFVLQSLLRVGKKTREAVIAKLRTLQPEPAEGESPKTEVDMADLDEDEAVEAIGFVLAAVVKGGASKGKKLRAVLGDDLGLHMKLMEKWQGATQPGEAQDSPS
jgi:hypothetical protein